MEAEALESIFLDDFERCDELRYRLSLSPEADEAHVGLVLEVRMDADYPSRSRPEFDIVEARGLAKDQFASLVSLANETALAAEGAVCVFEAATALKDWLSENNVYVDDSMYGKMLRREQPAILKQAAAKTEVDPEEVARLQRARDGIPFTLEGFQKWWDAFMKENKKPDEVARKATGKSMFVKGSAADVLEEDDDDAGVLDASLFQADDDENLDDLDSDDTDDSDYEDND